MTPRKIKRLKRLLSHPDYLVERRNLMRTESVLWWHDWMIGKDPDAPKASNAFSKKAEWYERRIGDGV